MLAPTPASPESAGMSKTALDRLENHLKQRYIDAGRFPGTQLLVYRRGKIVHSTVQGFADVERKAIADALKATGGNRAAAAKLLKMSRAALYDRLARYPDLEQIK